MRPTKAEKRQRQWKADAQQKSKKLKTGSSRR